MRISDWSSDVCSSDLSARAFRFIDQHLDHRRNRERGGHGLFLDKLQSRLRVKRGQDDMRGAEHGHAEYAARLSEVKHRRHVAEGDSALIAYQRMLSHEVVEQVGEAQHHSLGLPRCTSSSEEHTSEPQSLMRISYADFCLKTQITAT